MQRSFVVLCVLVLGVGCGSGADRNHQRAAPTRSSNVRSSGHPGSLSAAERSLATSIARRQQRRVTGTFVGATAFETRGTPFDRGSACDVDKALLNIRLVWKADANFTHSSPPDSEPDGPRKELLMTLDPRSGHVCETGAGYRNVGADADETLLYGAWPDPADG